LDAREQDRLAVARGSSRVEDGVHGIRPVAGAQDRVARVGLEKLERAPARAGSSAGSRPAARTPAASRSSAAWWKASVDSAPSLSFNPSWPSPALHPPRPRPETRVR